MKLLDEPLTKDNKKLLKEYLIGNINRIFVSNNPEEIVCMLGFAVDRLNMLAYSRIKELQKRGDKHD